MPTNERCQPKSDDAFHCLVPETREEQLDYLLFRLEQDRIERDRSSSLYRELSVEVAQKYIESERLHTPLLTSKILTQLLDSILIPFEKAAHYRDSSDCIVSLLPGIRKVKVPTGLFLLFVIVLGLSILALLHSAHLFAALCIAVYTAYHLIAKTIVNVRVRRQRSALAKVCEGLRRLQQEVENGNYDSVKIERCLREAERKGLLVDSLAHQLLGIRHHSNFRYPLSEDVSLAAV